MADEAAVLEQGGGAARPGAGWAHVAIYENSWKCSHFFASFSTLSHTRVSFSRFQNPLMSQCLLSLYAPITTHDNFPFLAVCWFWVTFPVAPRGSRGAGRLMGDSRLKWHRSWATWSPRRPPMASGSPMLPPPRALSWAAPLLSRRRSAPAPHLRLAKTSALQGLRRLSQSRVRWGVTPGPP